MEKTGESWVAVCNRGTGRPDRWEREGLSHIPSYEERHGPDRAKGRWCWQGWSTPVTTALTMYKLCRDQGMRDHDLVRSRRTAL